MAASFCYLYPSKPTTSLIGKMCYETFDLNSIGLGSTAKTRSAFGRPIIVSAISKAKGFSQQQSNCRTRTSRYELAA